MKLKINNISKIFDKLSIIYLYYNKINQNILYYGDDINKTSKNYRKLLFLIPLITIISILISMKISIYFILINFINIFIYLYPIIITEVKKNEQKKAIEDELIVFLLFAYINSFLGKSLYKTFEEISNSVVFKGLKKEAALLVKEVEVLGKSSILAIESRARVHKNDSLGKVYSTYLAGENIGISLQERIRDLIEESLDNLKSSLESYVNRANDIVEILFMLYLVTPMVLLAFQFISSSINLFMLLIPLFFSPGIYLMITLSQPNVGYNVALTTKEKLILLCLPLAIGLLLLRINLLYDIIIVYALFTIFTFFVYNRIKSSDDILHTMPNILSDIADYVKLGYGVRNSLLKLNEKNLDTKTTKFIGKVKELVKRDLPLTRLNTNSWVLNAVLEFLDNLEKKGYADSFIFKEISILIGNYITLREKILRNLQLFNSLSIATPFLLYFAFDVLSKIKSVGNLDPIVAIYSIVLGIIYAKLSRFTIFNFPLFLLLAISLSIIIFLGGLFMNFL
ncbi:Flp pilus assembly protein TadC [Sulfolobus sp. A20]|uniref:membrane pilin protein UpsF n=1 Tax=Saccharolobus sp. A20 TaxID=1891280 RepID=UPI000845CDDE|nr:Flp pilus assembly protein TadC [Sulfolobus sp. A20]AOL16217.1 Flp pilus assembly protein TadC [Sulfolobus sp. A20]TRM75119.1 Flp pilus assembly protein TadC [Sulfolobus sp. A20-N-F8]TRM79110.1 Flp pilus assembly protein TadC [Sulfolobus sp. B5]TRM82554.1 Flp pilus assembly protein TadC [Sulfolobus sp. D5]